MRARGRWAFAISLVGHALAIVGLFRALPASKPAMTSSDVRYPTLCTRIEEDLIDEEPLPLPVEVALEVPREIVQAKATPQRTNNPPLPASPSQVATSPSLHGPLTRPGLSVVYVLDRSGSMGGRKLATAVTLIKNSLRELGPETRFQIITYDSRPSVTRIGNQLGLVAANDRHRVDAGQTLDDLVGEGSSRHADALLLGLSLRPDLMIMLSDAGDMTPLDVARVRSANGARTIIHGVLLSRSPSASLEALVGAERIHHVDISP